jgi:hypothetical protein
VVSGGMFGSGVLAPVGATMMPIDGRHKAECRGGHQREGRVMRIRSWSPLLYAILLGTAGAQAADTSNIKWEMRGQFEACLEGRLNAWVFAKAELILNEDPAASDLDDMDVALWAATALQDCETQAGHGNQTSEQRFSRHMAHWREHIHQVAQTVRRRSGTD